MILCKLKVLKKSSLCGLAKNFSAIIHIFLYESQVKYYLYIRGAYDMFPDFFCMGTFIDSSLMKL